MKNLEIAQIFEEIADILEIQEVEWKPQAYRKAAMSIRSLSEDIEDVCNKRRLKDISGIGENIARKIEEIIKTGRLKYFERLKKQMPAGFGQLMNIPGIGPKTAKILVDKLKIKSKKDLLKAIKKKRLRNIEGFGEKTEQEILEGLNIIKTERHLLGDMLKIAREIKDELAGLKYISAVDIAGSLSRMKETIKDIDILAISSDHTKVMDFFTKMNDVKKVIVKGNTKTSVLLTNNIQVDLRVVDKKNYGSALQYFTGSKDHGINVRRIAIKHGYKLSEYGLFKGKRNVVAGKPEKDIYKKLGMQWPAPELREDSGEIDAALKNKLPKLIELKDINGDLHVHTKWSDGNNTIEEMARNAISLGYKYICISDHSKGLKIANGLTEKRLRNQLKEIDKVNKKLKKIHIFKGAEVDIKKNGNLDINKDMLKQLDIIIGSVHSGFKSSELEMTKRILNAMDNPNVNIIGHPTGRLLFKRNPYNINLEKIFEKAKERNIALEINAMPHRLDLNDVNARAAKDYGVKMVINTDAHAKVNMNYMELGVGVARRAWCEKSDIINSYSVKKLERFLDK
jgi:DNA polymerase (family 10)